ncbi:MAG: DMT family transporter [Gemmatimonadota bacterium]
MNLHRSSGRAGLGLGLALLTALVWGSLPVALKILIRHLDPLTVTWARFLVAGLLLLVSGAGRLRPGTWRVGWLWVVLLLAATVGMCGNYAFYVLGLAHTTPTTAQLVIQLSPLFLMAGSLVIFGERFGPRQWLGFAVLLAGLGAYFSDRIGELLAGWEGLGGGVLLIFAAALSWAVYALSQKQLLSRFHPTFVLLVIYLGGALLLWPLARPAGLLEQPPARLALLAATALVTLISYRSFAGALEHLEGSRVSLVISLTPLVTMVATAATAPLWPEHIQADPRRWVSLLGALLVVGGSMLTALGRRR